VWKWLGETPRKAQTARKLGTGPISRRPVFIWEVCLTRPVGLEWTCWVGRKGLAAGADTAGRGGDLGFVTVTQLAGPSTAGPTKRRPDREIL